LLRFVLVEKFQGIVLMKQMGIRSQIAQKLLRD
jgi:hypothetical protein